MLWGAVRCASGPKVPSDHPRFAQLGIMGRTIGTTRMARYGLWARSRWSRTGQALTCHVCELEPDGEEELAAAGGERAWKLEDSDPADFCEPDDDGR